MLSLVSVGLAASGLGGIGNSNITQCDGECKKLSLMVCDAASGSESG